MNKLKARPIILCCTLLGFWSHLWGATLPFGQTTTGTISSAAQTNTYTFSADTGDVIDFTLVATSGNLSPKIQVYNASTGALISSANPYACSGSVIELDQVVLPASTSGAYEVAISDCSETNTGSYIIYSQRTNNPSGAASLPFGQVETGSITSVAAENTYTFSASANEVVDFTLVATSGSLSPKIRLYNPSGSLNSSNNAYACSGSTVEMNTVTLPVTGTYTVLIDDCSDTNTGAYDIYAQLTENPVTPATLVFGQVETGSITSVAAENTYTFSANANDVVDFTLVTTSGSLSPKIRLYNPSGSLNSSNNAYACSGSTVEMNTVTLPVTGAYTVLIDDCSDTDTGSYVVYSQRTNNPSGPANLPFGQVGTGSIASVAAENTYTFSANAGDVVDFTLVATSGSLSPKIRLYNPSGSLNSSNNAYACSGSAVEMNTVTLPVTGAYTVLVDDCSDTNTGNYTIYFQRTNNPSGATGLLWGQLEAGTINSIAENGSFTLPGNANDVVNFTVVTTSGALSPRIRFYSPAGALVGSANPYACSGSTVELNSVTLPESGTYTVLISDCSDTNTGNYNLSSLCFGVCPLPAPVVTSISPANAVQGSNGFTLTVTGQNFVSGSVVTFNSIDLATTYVSATQLTAAVLPSNIATAGTVSVAVVNPAPLTGPSNAVSFTILTPQTITFAPLSNVTFGAAPFAVSATASSGLTVGFASTTTGVCTVSGTTVTIVATGSCSITASQSGNSTYAAATPVTQSFTVLTAQTITFGPLSNVTFGAAPFAVSATASSGLTVSFASTTTGVCTVSGATVTIVATGSCSITASQSGNSTYAAATSVTQSFTVLTPQTITFAPLSNVTFGASPFAVSATASSGLTVSFASTTTGVCTVSGTTVTLVATGICSITASQSGNSTYAAATSVTQSFTVLTAQTITFAPLSNVTFGASPFAVAATASSGLTVSFASTTTGVCTVSGTTVTLVATGSCSIAASQSGNSTYAAATAVTRTFTVLTAQTITFGPLSNQVLGSSGPSLSATASSMLTVTFTSNSTSVCTVSGVSVTLLAAGTCSLTASQAGNSTYAAATSVTQTFTVSATTGQTISFGSLNNEPEGKSNIVLSATASSGLTVTFTSNTPTVCTLSGANLNLIATGTCSITASQAGNSNYSAATPVTQTFTVTAGPNAVAAFRDIFGNIRLSTYAASALADSGGAFESDPSAAQDQNGNTFVTARDEYNAVWANVYNSGSSSWEDWEFGGGVIQGVPSIAVDPSSTGWIASRDSYNSYWLVKYSASSGFGTWTHLQGVFATDPVVTACGDGSIYVIGKDNYNALWSGHYIPGTGFQGWMLGGGVVNGKPAATCGGDNAVYIAAEDNYNSNWVARVSGNTWTGWFLGGAVTSVTPRIAALGNGSEAIVILDSAGSAWTTKFTEGTADGWQAWTHVGGVLNDIAPAAVGGLLYFIGNSGSEGLWWWQQTAGWTWIGNSGIVAGPLAAAPH